MMNKVRKRKLNSTKTDPSTNAKIENSQLEAKEVIFFRTKPKTKTT